MNNQMIDFTLAGKCGGFEANGLAPAFWAVAARQTVS